MTVPAFRIVQTHLATSAFDGEGARRYGGRWNSKGKRVVYTSSSLSLATLEVYVNLETHQVLGRKYSFIRVDIPPDVIQSLDQAVLNPGWDRDPPENQTKAIGDDWLNRSDAAVLEVPSAIVAEESNYLLNPLHPDFSRIGIGHPEQYRFSDRLTQ